MYKNFGRYPANNSFDDFRVDYENDLAEMVAEKKFFYTNNTTSLPPSPQSLEEIAGFGNSVIVKYEGLGAYFLDRLQEGVWRLEVLPDAIAVRDPFERANFQKHVTVIGWKQWPMTVGLADLGENFNIHGLNDGNEAKFISTNKTFAVSPGVYLLVKKGATVNFKRNDKWRNITLNEFVAPPPSIKKTDVLHIPVAELLAGSACKVDARVVAVKEPEWVRLVVFGRRFQAVVLPMNKVKGYDYSATIPDSLTREGYLNYYISVKEGGSITTYPSEVSGLPASWDYYDKNSYRVPVVAATKPVYLFDAVNDIDQMTRHFSSIYAGRKWVGDSYLSPANEEGKAELMLNVEKLYTEDPEYKTREKIHDCTFSQYTGKKISARKQNLPAMKELIFKGRALNGKPCRIQLALVMKDGSAYGGIITAGISSGDYSLLLADLKPVKYVLMPRPYPTFLPYYFDNKSTKNFDLSEVESIQFSIGPGIPENELEQKHGIAIESVRLQ
jgi:hypothetical protein